MTATLAAYVATVVRDDAQYMQGKHSFNPAFQPYSQGCMSKDHWEVFVPRPGEARLDPTVHSKRQGRERVQKILPKPDFNGDFERIQRRSKKGLAK